MIDLSDNAKKALEQYLQQVRACLRGCKTVDPDEIEQNITEHIENEFAAAGPVSLNELNRVLDKIGSPRQWIPEEELLWWRKTVSRLRTGPDDWRLAYISFGVFVLAFFAGRLAFFVLLLLSFMLARAAASEANSQQEELGAQKWLIYPPLLSMYATLALLILVWPWLYIVPELKSLCQSSTVRTIYYAPALNSRAASLILVGLGASICWAGLGVVFLIRPKWLSFLIRPFADKFSRTIARLLFLFGLAIAIVFAILFIWWRNACPTSIINFQLFLPFSGNILLMV